MAVIVPEGFEEIEPRSGITSGNPIFAKRVTGGGYKYVNLHGMLLIAAPGQWILTQGGLYDEMDNATFNVFYRLKNTAPKVVTSFPINTFAENIISS